MPNYERQVDLQPIEPYPGSFPSQSLRISKTAWHISSDQIAGTRHRPSSILYDQHGQVPPEQRREALESLFIILWAMPRVAAVRATLPWTTRVADAPWSGPHKLLRESTEEWGWFSLRNYEIIADQTYSDTAGSGGGLIELAIARRLTDKDEDSFTRSNAASPTGVRFFVCPRSAVCATAISPATTNEETAVVESANDVQSTCTPSGSTHPVAAPSQNCSE